MFVSRWLFQQTVPRRSEVRSFVSTALAPRPRFTAFDRCDRCGAQAYVRFELANGGELMFCAHHARAHSSKLSEIATKVDDDTAALDGSSDAGASS